MPKRINHYLCIEEKPLLPLIAIEESRTKETIMRPWELRKT